MPHFNRRTIVDPIGQRSKGVRLTTPAAGRRRSFELNSTFAHKFYLIVNDSSPSGSERVLEGRCLADGERRFLVEPLGRCAIDEPPLSARLAHSRASRRWSPF